MTDQAKEEYLVPGAKAHLFHSPLDRKFKLGKKQSINNCLNSRLTTSF